MNRLCIITIIFILSSTALLMAQVPAQESINNFTGKPAPSFCLPNLKSEKVYLSELIGNGRVIILNYFATYCKPCRKEMPELDGLIRSYPSDSVMLIFIDGGEKRDTVLKFVNNYLYDGQSFGDVYKLVKFLKIPKKPIAKFLIGKFSDSTKKTIAQCTSQKDMEKSLADSLVSELNKLVYDPALYRNDVFAKIKQSPQTAAFMRQSAKDVEITKLNRSLLDDALRGFVHPKIFFGYEGCPWTLLVDQYNLAGRKYEVSDYPKTIIIDSAGVVVYECTGYTAKNMTSLASIMDSLFNKKKPNIKGKRKGK